MNRNKRTRSRHTPKAQPQVFTIGTEAQPVDNPAPPTPTDIALYYAAQLLEQMLILNGHLNSLAFMIGMMAETMTGETILQRVEPEPAPEEPDLAPEPTELDAEPEPQEA